MRSNRKWCWTLLALITAASVVSADSIWDRRERRSAYLFTDSRARQIGDVLTVVVSENTDVNNTDQRQMSKDTKMGGLFNFKGATKGGQMSRDGQVDFDASGSSNRSFEGSSNYTANQKLVDRMSVTVVDVLPNGNLVIEGFRRRVVSGENRTIRLSGIVRPNDISLINTIESARVASFQINYVGKGPQSSFTNQNYLGRVLNFLWPF